MDLRYLTPLAYPSRFVNRLQVMKMSESFSRLAEKFTLYVRELRAPIKEIFGDYDVRNEFNVLALGKPHFWPKSLFFARRVSIIIKHNPDTVWFLRDGLLAFWLSYFLNIRSNMFFFEVHAFERLPSFVYRRVFGVARGIITTNKKKADDLTKIFGVPKDKIIVALNGVDLNFKSNLSREEARKRLSLPMDEKLIIYIGTPSEEKGILTLLKLAQLLPPEIKIISVGGRGNEIANFKSNENFRKIIWVEQVSHQKAGEYMSAADMLLAPFSGKSNWTSLYTSPLKIPEYLLMAKPIVISNLPSIREFVSDNEVFFFEADNAHSLLDVINGAFANPQIMLEKARRAATKAKDFSWEGRAKVIYDFMLEKSKQS